MSDYQAMAMANQLEVPSSPVGVYTLPCGYLDPQGVLHKEVELHEMTMAEMDLMASNKVPAERKFDLLLGRCLKRVGDITDPQVLLNMPARLPVGDRVFILLMLRQISVGDDYPLQSICPACKHKGTWTIPMSSLRIQPMPEPEKRQYSLDLPSGKSATFKIMVGADEVSAKRHDSVFSSSLMARLVELDGVPPTLQEIKRLSPRDADALMTAFDKVDGGVDTTLELECPSCSHEFDQELDPGQTGFFFPSRVKSR